MPNSACFAGKADEDSSNPDILRADAVPGRHATSARLQPHAGACAPTWLMRRTFSSRPREARQRPASWTALFGARLRRCRRSYCCCGRCQLLWGPSGSWRRRQRGSIGAGRASSTRKRSSAPTPRGAAAFDTSSYATSLCTGVSGHDIATFRQCDACWIHACLKHRQVQARPTLPYGALSCRPLSQADAAGGGLVVRHPPPGDRAKRRERPGVPIWQPGSGNTWHDSHCTSYQPHVRVSYCRRCYPSPQQRDALLFVRVLTTAMT